MKNSYQNGNWKQYNKSLINRGSITFWVSEDSLKKWRAKKDKKHFG
ncbi:MAG TPA: IS5/IS1182 family transposase, partial [Chlamydiae bacterium]|nr:IS5/IS1182 family transposase [Chlamydiota bacterium]